MRLTTAEVCRYGNCTPTSRHYLEGERILNAKPRSHLLNCGKTGFTDSIIKLQAYVVSTSGLRGTPHSINGEIDINDCKVKRFECSCKAGSGEQCKHILAVLIHCNR